MSCVHQMQNEAVMQVKEEQKREYEAKMTALVSKVKSHLLQNGVDQAQIEGLDELDPLIMETPAPHCSSNKRNGVELQAATMKRRKENRKGEKEIEGRANFQRWSAKEKLEFIDSKAAESTSKYKNSCRQWLIRVNPIAKCFRHCCQRDVDIFLTKHGNGKGNFSLTKVSPKMAGCETCCKSSL